MKVTVVGCSGSVPGPASPASCYLVEADDAEGRTWCLALDMGSGALGGVQKYCDPLVLDAVALSHLHPDHCADLAALHVYLSYHPDGPKQVPIYGPFGTAGRIDHLRGASQHSDVLDVVVWQPGGTVKVGPMSITVEAVVHPIPAYAMRIEGPSELPARHRAVLAYSGDTDQCAALESVAAGADVFLCEASYTTDQDAPAGVHMTGAQAGAVATAAGVDRLVLTHVPPWTDPNVVFAEARSTFAGPLERAHAGQRLVL